MYECCDSRRKRVYLREIVNQDTVIRLKDANGFYLDLLQPESGPERDAAGIRMNVDDFDAACRLRRAFLCKFTHKKVPKSAWKQAFRNFFYVPGGRTYNGRRSRGRQATGRS